jgi:tetratricopeptide (TPR) repeat protein
MSRYFMAMRNVLERHEGTVEKYIGDAVMAVFGIPSVHEDDAVRACRAALEMRERLEPLNAELDREHGIRLMVRIGINTGEVVSGDPARGQGAVIGDAVNLAARLEQAADPGEILIGRSTLRLVKDAFVTDPVEPLVVKGKSQRVTAYRLIREVAGARAGRRLDSPMVGRNHEIERLRRAFDRAIAESSCRLFTILGPPGVGKSRLAEEFARGADGTATVLRGECLPYGDGITFWPVAQALRQAAGITDPDSPAQARDKITAPLEGEAHASVVAARVAQVIGLAETGAGVDEMFWALRRFLEVLARTRPVVCLIDDIQWAQPALLDLFEYMLEWSRNAPMLIVCVARPDLLDHRPTWGAAKSAEQVELEELGPEETETLLANLLGTTENLEGVRHLILDAAEGNPLFVEEMLSMLIDDGVLRREEERWIVTGEFAGISVPPTVQALLAARLDRLQHEERQVIQRAAVVGDVFYWGAVTDLCSEDVQPRVGTHLMTLVRRDLIRSDRSDFADEDAFRFRHILVRDAAYQGLPKALRADLHERFAGWLEVAAGNRVSEYEEILGYHLEQAAGYRSELEPADERRRDLAARAADRLGSAGLRAIARGDISAASNLLHRAVSLLDESDPRWLELLPDLGSVLSEQGEFTRANALLGEAIGAAERAGDVRLRAHALLARYKLRLVTSPEGVTQEIEQEAEGLRRTLEEIGDDLGLGRLWNLIAFTGLMRSRYAEVMEAAERALPHARQAHDRYGEEQAATWLAVSLAFGPLPVREALDRVRRLQDESVRHGEGAAVRMVSEAVLLAMAGRPNQARVLVDRGRAMLTDIGLRLIAAAGSQFAGMIEILAGKLEAAERVLREGYEILEVIGEKSYLSTTAAWLADVYYRIGRLDDAQRYASIAEEAGASEDVTTQVAWRGVRARLLASSGRMEEAERLAKEAVSLADATDNLSMRGDIHVHLAEVFRIGGRLEEARKVANEAVTLYTERGNVAATAWAHSFLEEVSREQTRA